MAADPQQIIPPKQLSIEERDIVFRYFFHRLAVFRNTHEVYARKECELSDIAVDIKEARREQVIKALNQWSQDLLQKAWVVCKLCEDEEAGKCPIIDETADTSTIELTDMPDEEAVNALFTTILFLHITTSKQYSAYTRAFLMQSEPGIVANEQSIVRTLRNPEWAVSEAQTHTEETRTTHADQGRMMRLAGIGLGAVAGGVLVGVSGGLAAPLVSAGVTSVLGWFGIAGTTAGLMASGLAGSSLVCGTLFGAYGAKSTADMVQRHTREVRDLAVLPVRPRESEETLGVRLCISGWLTEEKDVTAPWTIFEGDDTFALQWEIDALKKLSDALYQLISSNAMQYIKAEIIRRTMFASLMSALSPVALLKIGEIMGEFSYEHSKAPRLIGTTDNPWMNARALAIKTGAVLSDLLVKRAFGNRPVTLVGYSLGSLVIFEALRHLAGLPVSESFGLVENAFMFGTPVPADPKIWARLRRVTAGRIVNGYADDDYVLAVLSRASDASWRVAGLGAVDVQGVENVHCEEVTGHTMWQGMVGKYLEACHARGIVESEVEAQVHVAEKFKQMAEEAAPEIASET